MANYNAIKYDGFSKGSTTLIKTLTASSSATLSFEDGSSSVVLDSTYKEYLFILNSLHPATDNVNLGFQGNAAGGSGYDETMTTSFFRARHKENGTEGEVDYDTNYDQAQGTGFQVLSYGTGNDNDQSCSGYLHLFNPSDTTFIKHFIAKIANCGRNDHSRVENIAGYFNTTSAIDEIQFKFSSGDIDAGTIQLFGVS
jgi:hypothetical protein